MSDTTRAQELVGIRTTLRLSQAEMAYKLELTLREYQALEWGESEIPNIYLWAVQRLAMAYAAVAKDPRMVPASIMKDAQAVVQLTRSV